MGKWGNLGRLLVATHVSTFKHCGPFQQCIQRCKTTRHLCSVATCGGRSTRNVNMPPPHHPFMTSEHTCTSNPLSFQHCGPFRQCIQSCKTTRHLCSAATCGGRSTRNVNMPPPPLHDLRTHASKNVFFYEHGFRPGGIYMYMYVYAAIYGGTPLCRRIHLFLLRDIYFRIGRTCAGVSAIAHFCIPKSFIGLAP